MGIHPLDAAIRWTEGRSWMIDIIRKQDLNKLEVRLKATPPVQRALYGIVY